MSRHFHQTASRGNLRKCPTTKRHPATTKQTHELFCRLQDPLKDLRTTTIAGRIGNGNSGSRSASLEKPNAQERTKQMCRPAYSAAVCRVVPVPKRRSM